MAQWTADVRVDEALARQLIAAQFPPLPERSLGFLGEGWDYTAFLVDGSLVFRFPRREIGLPGTGREIRKSLIQQLTVREHVLTLSGSKS